MNPSVAKLGFWRRLTCLWPWRKNHVMSKFCLYWNSMGFIISSHTRDWRKSIETILTVMCRNVLPTFGDVWCVTVLRTGRERDFHLFCIFIKWNNDKVITHRYIFCKTTHWSKHCQLIFFEGLIMHKHMNFPPVPKWLIPDTLLRVYKFSLIFIYKMCWVFSS